MSQVVSQSAFPPNVRIRVGFGFRDWVGVRVTGVFFSG